MSDITIHLTAEELGEMAAKIANELETYGDEATSALRSGFMKLWRAGMSSRQPIYITTLMTKWAMQAD